LNIEPTSGNRVPLSSGGEHWVSDLRRECSSFLIHDAQSSPRRTFRLRAFKSKAASPQTASPRWIDDCIREALSVYSRPKTSFNRGDGNDGFVPDPVIPPFQKRDERGARIDHGDLKLERPKCWRFRAIKLSRSRRKR